MENERNPTTSRKRNQEEMVTNGHLSNHTSAKVQKNKETIVAIKQEIPDIFITYEDLPPNNPHPKKPKEELPQSQSLVCLEKERKEEQNNIVSDSRDSREAKDNKFPNEWPKSDVVELFKRIEKECPKDDYMKHDARVNLVDWEKIKFKEYSAEECKNLCCFALKHVRHHRIFKELMNDVLMWMNQPWYNFNQGVNDEIEESKTENRNEELASVEGLSMRMIEELGESSSSSSTPKSSRKSKSTSPSPPWNINRPLFNANEPPKPPVSAAVYYVMCNNSRYLDLSKAEIDSIWKEMNERQKKKVIVEHQKKIADYLVLFEKFLLTLNDKGLGEYGCFVSKRDERNRWLKQ